MQAAAQVNASYLCVTTQNEPTKQLDVLEPIQLPQSTVDTCLKDFQALNPSNLLHVMPQEGVEYLDWDAVCSDPAGKKRIRCPTAIHRGIHRALTRQIHFPQNARAQTARSGAPADGTGYGEKP
jgi:hypothetical protein